MDGVKQNFEETKKRMLEEIEEEKQKSGKEDGKHRRRKERKWKVNPTERDVMKRMNEPVFPWNSAMYLKKFLENVSKIGNIMFETHMHPMIQHFRDRIGRAFLDNFRLYPIVE